MLNEHQRTFLGHASAPRALIVRRVAWRSVIVPDGDAWRVVASLRGADLASLIGRYVWVPEGSTEGEEWVEGVGWTEDKGCLCVTPLGLRLGRLYALYHAAIDMYTLGRGLGHDINALLEDIEQRIWMKVQEAEQGA